MFAQPQTLIAIDVDGTLLNSRHCLAHGTLQAIIQARDMGIMVTLATGKILPSVLGIVNDLDLSLPLILANGALLQYPNGDIVAKHVISENITDTILVASSNSFSDLVMYTSNAIFVTKSTSNTSLVVDYGEPEPIELPNRKCLDLIKSDICKLVFINRRPDDELSFLQSHLSDVLGDMVTINRSVPSMLEITANAANKGTGLIAVARHLGITMESVIAIGDSYNDLDMFNVAGYSVAMGNAPLRVKQAADKVTGSNDEDGIADFLQDLFLELL